MPCRLIRVPAKGQAKHDVWLLTDVLDPARLSLATAAKFYRWRWRNEGVFRTYKRTINKLKLSSRTVRLVHREAEVSLAGVADPPGACGPGAATEADRRRAPVISPRKVLIEIRRELNGTARSGRGVTRSGCRVAGRTRGSRRVPRRPANGPAASRTSLQDRPSSTP